MSSETTARTGGARRGGACSAEPASTGLALGALDLGSLGLPLDLQDAAQQSTAFTATALLIAGGTAIWMALVLLLRTPISHRA